MLFCSQCCKSGLLKSCVIYVKLLPSMLNSLSNISGGSSGLEGTQDFGTENKAIALLILHKSCPRSGVPELRGCNNRDSPCCYPRTVLGKQNHGAVRAQRDPARPEAGSHGHLLSLWEDNYTSPVNTQICCSYRNVKPLLCACC